MTFKIKNHALNNRVFFGSLRKLADSDFENQFFLFSNL